MQNLLIKYWRRFWLRFSGIRGSGKIAAWLAAVGTPPFYGRIRLAAMTPQGYVSPKATICHPNLKMGRHGYIDDGVLIYRDNDGGTVTLGDGVHLHRDTIIQTGQDGYVEIGAQTHIQPRCQLSAYKGSIVIKNRVEIAPNCSFYPYSHGMAPDLPIQAQAMQSKGGITIEDDAWIGVGAIILDGVRIGKGVVIGAGAVVTKDIPDLAIAFGSPAQVVKRRDDPEFSDAGEKRKKGDR